MTLGFLATWQPGNPATNPPRDRATARPRDGETALTSFLNKLARVTLTAGPKSMSSFKVRLFGEFSAIDHRGNTLALGSRWMHATLAWMAMHLDAPAPLRDFHALFGGESAGALSRDVRYA